MIWIARVSWIALSVLLVALIASPAPSCPVRQIISAPVVVASTPVVVVKEKVVVAEVFTPVFVPTFSVSYSPPPAYPAPQNPNTSSSAQSGPSELAQVLGELRNLGRRIDALERGASPSPKSPPALTPSPKDGAGVTPDGKQTGSKTHWEFSRRSVASATRPASWTPTQRWPCWMPRATRLPPAPSWKSNCCASVTRAKCLPRATPRKCLRWTMKDLRLWPAGRLV